MARAEEEEVLPPIYARSVRRPDENNSQVGFPHVGADEFDALTQLLADEIEELLETLDCAIFPDPQQPSTVLLNLIDQGEMFMPFGILDLVDADRADLTQIAMRKSPLHDVLDGVKYFIPRCAERNRGFLPRELSRPMGQK